VRLPASAACCRNRYWRSGKALAGSGGDGGVWVDFGIWAEAEKNLLGDHDARSGCYHNQVLNSKIQLPE